MRTSGAALLLSGLLWWTVAPAAVAGERLYVLPEGQGALQLPVPSGWVEEPREAAWEGPTTITFYGRGSEDFRVLVMPLHGAETDVAALVKGAARGIADLAAEREIEVRPLGSGAIGYWFRYTDGTIAGPTPPVGEYVHTVQGAALVGPLTVTFTILTNDRNSAAATAALQMMRGARYRRDI